MNFLKGKDKVLIISIIVLPDNSAYNDITNKKSAIAHI